MIPTYLVTRLVAQHCKVALGGDGGDELFGGYVHYNRFLRMQRLARRMPHFLRWSIARGASALLPIGFRARNWLQNFDVDFSNGLPFVGAQFDSRSRRQLMRNWANWPLVGEAVRERAVSRTADLLQRATRCDFENYLAEDILVKVDRASMLNSLEVRAPLLDHRIIELAFARVPRDLKATTQQRKILLKRLAARVLPPQFDRQRKQGFSIPLAAWLRSGPWHRLFHEVLLGADGNLFDRGTVRKLLDGQARGRRNSERLFALLLLELWRQEYRIRV
jgi:asparagine synthase (glutamine-hydrolysing)